MSNISSKDAWPVKLMRWIARFLSIPWAYGAIFIAWFCMGCGYHEGERTLARLVLLIIAMIIPLLMFLGAAIIASVWGKEAFGGAVLLADGVLIIVCSLVDPNIRPDVVSWGAVLAISALVLPPLVAGSLFLICHLWHWILKYVIGYQNMSGGQNKRV